jgi:hypothetical protein
MASATFRVCLLAAFCPCGRLWGVSSGILIATKNAFSSSHIRALLDHAECCFPSLYILIVTFEKVHLLTYSKKASVACEVV